MIRNSVGLTFFILSLGVILSPYMSALTGGGVKDEFYVNFGSSGLRPKTELTAATLP